MFLGIWSLILMKFNLRNAVPIFQLLNSTIKNVYIHTTFIQTREN